MGVADRHGRELVSLGWDGDVLVGLEANPSTLVRGERVPHLLFGAAHPVMAGSSEPVTWMGAIDWARPEVIPPIEHPARLPAGSGTIILNTLALLAEHAGVTRLRYAGPYPTSALWQSLLQSFRPLEGDEARFTDGALARAARADMSPVAVDLAPAPFERHWVTATVWAQVRDQLERVMVGGEIYTPGHGVRRLVPTDEPGWTAAEVWLGGAPYARVAIFNSDDGGLSDWDEDLPPVESPVMGQALPAPLRAALAELVAELLPPLLAAGAAAVLADLHVEWGDAGAAAARDRGDRVIVHAALWDRLAPRGLGEVALALAEALAPPVATRAQARLAAGLR